VHSQQVSVILVQRVDCWSCCCGRLAVFIF